MEDIAKNMEVLAEEVRLLRVQIRRTGYYQMVPMILLIIAIIVTSCIK